MGIKIRLYIGADNKTKVIDDEYKQKIVDVLKKYWKGFTLSKKTGYYEGQVEESIEAVIMVLNLVFKDLFDCMDELKIKLVQKEILYEVEYDVDFKMR
ncbi:MAG: hypothetical protein WC471_01730 [Candidatus Woesearchaeota archaeon]